MLKTLKNTDFFADFSLTELKNIALASKLVAFNAKAPIFMEGDKARGFYIVMTGSIKVFQISAKGKESIVNILTSNDIIALPAALKGETFPASAEAIEGSSLIYIPAKPFLDALKENPRLGIKTVSSLSRLLHTMVGRLSSVTLKSAPARVASLILSGEKGTNVFHLTSKKTTIATQLNMTLETLSRTLSKFKAGKLISEDSDRIKILNRERLEEISEDFSI